MNQHQPDDHGPLLVCETAAMMLTQSLVGVSHCCLAIMLAAVSSQKMVSKGRKAGQNIRQCDVALNIKTNSVIF